MTHEGAALFRELVHAVSDGHFRPCDRPLLASYCEALVLARQASAELSAHGPVDHAGKLSPWLKVHETATRSITALSARLRLCPQSRLDRTRAGVSTRAPAATDSRFDHYFTGSVE